MKFILVERILVSYFTENNKIKHGKNKFKSNNQKINTRFP